MITKKRLFDYFGLNAIRKKESVFVLICLILCGILFFIPTGFEGAQESGAHPVKAQIIETDNSQIHIVGLIKIGSQALKVRILEGDYKGQTRDTVNHFLGKLDLDKFYSPGEKVLAVLEIDENVLNGVRVIDRYRLDMTLFLVLLFVFLLVLYAGWIGFKAIISFFITTLVIWKVMLPGYLRYVDPIILSLTIVTILSALTIFLVAGFTKKGLVAFIGSFSGIIITCIIALLCGRFFKIPGEILPWSEGILYMGFLKLKLADIFLSGIFIASTGAVMDVAMDVAASQEELAMKNPDISVKEHILSGFRVGRVVIGTMTTTLLLAYSGGYSTLLMMFIAQGVPVMNILNYQIVSAEILHTVVGSFGLVAVAPLTAIAGGLIFSKGKNAL